MSQEITVQKHVPLPQKYSFVKKGDAYVTRSCTNEAKAAGRDIYIIQDGTSRVGIGVPSIVLHKVKAKSAETANQRADARSTKLQKEHEAAAAALARLYPKFQLPVSELLKAWDVGSGRVGRTAKLDLDKKVELAAVAVARHRFTQYDRLLNDGVEREKARRLVREQVHRTLEYWKGSIDSLRALAGSAFVTEEQEKQKGTEKVLAPIDTLASQSSFLPHVIQWSPAVMRALSWVGDQLIPTKKDGNRVGKPALEKSRTRSTFPIRKAKTAAAKPNTAAKSNANGTRSPDRRVRFSKKIHYSAAPKLAWTGGPKGDNKKKNKAARSHPAMRLKKKKGKRNGRK